MPRQSTGWQSALPVGHPALQPYRTILQALPALAWRQPELLNSILPAGVCNAAGHPIRFIDQASLAPQPYEQRIAASGIVSTRSQNWHDVCNALVWARLPHSKSACNTLHLSDAQAPGPGRRGLLRDALTLLDESGLLLLSDDQRLLEALRRHDWQQAFVTLRASWPGRARLLVMGHAVLEKLLNPFKAITAKALLIRAPGEALALPWPEVDRVLSRQLLARAWLQQPHDLAALPVMGIPGWWSCGPQDGDFYADPEVFRPPRAGFSPAPLLDWPDAGSPPPAGSSPPGCR